MKLSVEDVSELMYGGSVEGIEEIETTIVDTTRWSVVKELVFRKDGELWAFTYEVGATEKQEYEPEAQQCYRVEAVQVTAYKRAK